ncbi:TonB-dependent receptor [Sphingobacterium sp. SRCM116780]|uniref:SusC/RagA family TonB-linked outer membrane protein n=1 Tax=Sphingobacterium sp. SRCM116780 TaxID=2907623 RepID=UPI001F3DB1F4|nr:TonB-dependent receptor [Sphingobacterium sp. SRCM116780]UIR56228.1 TonB-dependent receptor [Sphingobacterium sp. SRCM116780]
MPILVLAQQKQTTLSKIPGRVTTPKDTTQLQKNTTSALQDSVKSTKQPTGILGSTQGDTLKQHVDTSQVQKGAINTANQLKNVDSLNKTNSIADSSKATSNDSLSVEGNPPTKSEQPSSVAKGLVQDQNGKPIQAVTVSVKGAAGSAITDEKGAFEINAKVNQVLEFSSVGFKTTEHFISNLTGIVVKMTTATNTLGEVVVVSYGSQNKKALTGSVTQIKSEDIQDIPAAEFGQKLQGKVPGLQINQVTGRPGQGMTFKLRGAASLGSGNQPLVVVDGMPISGDINMINPDDVESFSVLKDASATSLYGSRAANGVILITTKKGKEGVTSVSLNAYYGIQQVPQRGRPEIMNGKEFATFMKGFYEDKIKYEGWVDPETKLAKVPADYANPEQYGAGTDWYNELLRTAPIQNYNLNINGGSEKFLTSNSATFFSQEGVMQNTGMKRFSMRSNSEYKPNDYIKIGFNISPTYQIDKNTRGPLDGNRQILSGGMMSSPLIPVYNEDGGYNTTTSSYGMYALPNFYQQLHNAAINQNTLRLLGNAFLEVEPLEHLKVKTAISTDVGTMENNAFYPSTYGSFGNPPPIVANANHSSNNYASWLSETTVNYTFDLQEDHHFDVLGGYSAQRYERTFRNISGNNFPSDDIPWIVGAITTNGTTDRTAWTVQSWFGRLNYNFKDRYFLTANIRRDGSSRFGSERKYGTFPSVSAGWVISEENFFNKEGVVNFMKIRGSYGKAGNNNIGDYTHTSLVRNSNYVEAGAIIPGTAITSLGNPYLTWETSTQADAGIELSLFNSRITFGYDYFNKRTEGMLYQIDLPYSSGFPSVKSNVGEFKMWGHEFNFDTKNLTGDFKWNTNFNFSFNDNKVIRLNNGVAIGGTGQYNDYNQTAEGRRIGEFYGYVFDGVYMNQAEFAAQPKHLTSQVGTARMKDINGDGEITADDKTYLGNPNPTFLFGMTNDFKYKNFDLSIVASGQAGNKIMDINKQNTQNLDGIFNIEKDMADRWRSPENPGNGKVPRTLANTTELYRFANSNWVYSGTYLTIRNITLGYTFPEEKLKFLKSLRLYTSVNQAFVFTKYPGQNPEVNDARDDQTKAGLDNGSYPVPRTFTFGLNVNF